MKSDARFPRRALRGSLLLPALLGGACGGEPDAPPGPTPENPLVIESPRVRVLAGPDTLQVFQPTVFGYFVYASEGSEPSPGLLQAAQALETGLRGVEPALAEMGVRVVLLSHAPRPLDGGGTTPSPLPRAAAEVGYLLAGPRAGLHRLPGTTAPAQLVCEAARHFGVEAPAGRPCA